MDGKDTKEVVLLWKSAVDFKISVDKPVLWTAENPSLYQLCISLYVGETCLETRTQTVGIRSAAFHPKKGFLLNGASEMKCRTKVCRAEKW